MHVITGQNCHSWVIQALHCTPTLKPHKARQAVHSSNETLSSLLAQAAHGSTAHGEQCRYAPELVVLGAAALGHERVGLLQAVVAAKDLAEGAGVEQAVDGVRRLVCGAQAARSADTADISPLWRCTGTALS